MNSDKSSWDDPEFHSRIEPVQYSPEFGKTTRPPQITAVQISLFLITLISTMMAGATNEGAVFPDMLLNPLELLKGLDYAIALLLILSFHEFGHFFAARYHNINVTYPYYIPLPIPMFFHFGTMGAVIRLKGMMPNRNALMDVAVAGPLAGFVASLICLFYGFSSLTDLGDIRAHVETIHEWEATGPNLASLALGKSLLFGWFHTEIGNAVLPMSEAYHFPFVFAGWIGLLVTAINLIPIGQLDGGHITYALFGRQNAKRLSQAAYGAIVLLSIGLYWRYGMAGTAWVLWMGILLLIGLKHPPTMDDRPELTPLRKALGWTCLAIFFLCFIPLPIFFEV